jgi:hypothetical protein
MAKKVGRPKIEFSPDEMKKMEVLAAMGASNESIAEFLGCSVDTLDRNYADTLKKGKDRMKNNLRIAQYRLAMNGSVAMLIWLGKQLLGQSERRGFDDGGIGDGFNFVDPGDKK